MGTVLEISHFSNLRLYIGLFEELGNNEFNTKMGFKLTLDPYVKDEYKAAASQRDQFKMNYEVNGSMLNKSTL